MEIISAFIMLAAIGYFAYKASNGGKNNDPRILITEVIAIILLIAWFIDEIGLS